MLIDWYVSDGQTAENDDVICKLTGNARALLTGERTALNFLQTLSATATTTAKFVEAIAGTKARILDTRKTLPGLRHAQKYAVTVGGGENHRFGLYDAILIKENHIKRAGGIVEALSRARDTNKQDLSIVVEVESIDELREALDAGAIQILLDNFTNEDLKEAVSVNNDYAYVAAKLEASGNIALKTVREIAATGVDFISVGSLTKNVTAIDLSMLFQV